MLSVLPESPTIGRVDVRDRFISYLLETNITRPVDIGDDGELLRQLGLAAFLFGQQVTAFVEVTVPMLLRQLSRITEPERVKRRGQIRGRIDWAATYKTRFSEDNDPTVFVCRQVRRQYATLENELLKYVLTMLQDLVNHVPSNLHPGAYWSPHPSFGPRPVRLRLIRLNEKLTSYLKHIYLREIETPHRITSRHLLRARTSKTEWYAEVADLHDHYVHLVVEVRTTYLVDMLRQCLILPASPDGLGDDMIKLAAWALTTSQ